jgi:hypothetical protein
MRLGWFGTAESYVKHLFATDPLLGSAWVLGTMGLAMPFFFRDTTAKEAQLAKATTKYIPPPNVV